MNDTDLLKCFDLTPEAEAGNVKEVIYGIKDGMVISRKSDSMMNEHTAILGSSGSMKSRAFARGKIISCALKGESICCTDPKGELASDTKAYLEDMGYTVKILNLVDPKNSDRFDGLEGSRDEPIFVSNIVEAAISNTGGAKGDHFFDAAEGSLLSALTFLQMERETGEFPTIAGAYRTLVDIKSVQELNDIFDELPPGSRGLRSYNLFRMASPNVQGNVIIGLGARLAVMQNDEIADLMSFPDMDMLALGKQKTAYFLVLSDQDSTMRFVSAMFFSLLFLRLVQFADNDCPGRRLPVPVNLILDELCSVVGAIKDFHIKMSNVRSRGINISYFFQALGQLQNRYPDNMWSEVLSGADTTLIMGCNDPVSAKYVSERSGEVTIYADTVMKQRNIFLPAMLQPSFRHSEGTGRRKLLTLDEVLRMEPKNMLLMLRGQQILEIEKFDYTRNPESGKFRPVPIKGLKEVPQYPA
ncbi:MAG: type IV secretory system conjugative DNA transfer family protein [Oscillospiraceae bacterium]|nr:type IV secretory system conjugative DNA transfer family protein [Oscillospiraceae bacterium]